MNVSAAPSHRAMLRSSKRATRSGWRARCERGAEFLAKVSRDRDFGGFLRAVGGVVDGRREIDGALAVSSMQLTARSAGELSQLQLDLSAETLPLPAKLTPAERASSV